MPWTKDAVSMAPKTVYEAPASAWPMVRMIYDPSAEFKWCAVYANLNGDDSQAAAELVMGLG